MAIVPGRRVARRQPADGGGHRRGRAHRLPFAPGARR
jgi:hypothetical protein